MLVSHRKRFIYTKTAKTGGTSVESYFEPWCMKDGAWREAHYRDETVSKDGIIGYRGPQRPKGCKWWNHMPARLIREQLGEPTWSAYFKFCIVRNPFDKAASGFYFMRKEGQIQVDASQPDPVQFERWLETNGPPLDADKYVIDGQPCMDHVLRYENLQAELAAVCARLDIPWEPAKLPTFKAGIRPARDNLRQLFTPRSEEIVRKAHALEIGTFGYEFPG